MLGLLVLKHKLAGDLGQRRESLSGRGSDLAHAIHIHTSGLNL